ncbi:MAG TPA: DUF5698 domain-containing protein [Acidimicrobiia bacterium]|jgi:uncharacterized protein YebE (UPF0316 family)|nr:DUF5698 domain-containing protein [Acidimicrobiia bacterium]
MDSQLLLDLILIFTLRSLDVGIATVRIVVLGRGRRGLAAGLGFVEAIVWVVAVARVLDGIDDPARMIAFAAGFAIGTYLGSIVEEWLALGQAVVRIVAPVESPMVAPHLREMGFGATVFNGDGLEGEVRLTLCVVERKRLGDVRRVINTVNPAAYVTVEDTSSVDVVGVESRVRR